MNLDLVGRKALVTGGTYGIGRAIVLALAHNGVDVVTCYRKNKEAADQLIQDLESREGKHQVIQADMCQPNDVTRLVEEAGNYLGQLDILIHNVGVSDTKHIPFAKLPISEWQYTININMTAAFLLVQQMLPLLTQRSSVIFFSSKLTFTGLAGTAHYGAAKAGLVGMAASLSKEFGRQGIRFNIIELGMIDSEENTPSVKENSYIQKRRDNYRERSALGRLGRPEEVANAVLFLASNLSSYVTGHTLALTGGFTG